MDGDDITIATDDDLAEAINVANGGIVRLKVATAKPAAKPVVVEQATMETTSKPASSAEQPQQPQQPQQQQEEEEQPQYGTYLNAIVF